MNRTIVACAVAFAISVAYGCSQPAQEVQLVAESREGVFLMSFAEAKSVAQAENKMILVDMWRPG